MSLVLRTVILFTTIALSNASPFQAFKRQDPPPLPFPQTTCGSQPELSALNLSPNLELPQVNVTRDCDTAIDAICKWVADVTKRGTVPVEGYRHIEGECEGHLYYPRNLRRTDAQAQVITAGPDYDTCVQGFQDITINCMLPDDARTSKQQYGVKNVAYTPPDSEQWFQWGDRDAEDSEVGFMMGAQGAFGDEAMWFGGGGSDLPMCKGGLVATPNRILQTCPHLSYTIILFTAIALSNASPFLQLPKRETQITTEFNASTTCGSQLELQVLQNVTNLPIVDVRADCDDAIDILCKAVAQKTSYFRHTTRNCEGHYYAAGRDYPNPDYETCVQGFQKITIGCMLPDEAQGPGVPQYQYGISNVKFTPADPESEDPKFSWTSSDPRGADPGFMMGAKGAFGDENKWIGPGNLI
ncbi:MAG: hypothetical protein Q9169_002469 [Polycauliona sp. 2 TL-2023]